MFGGLCTAITATATIEMAELESVCLSVCQWNKKLYSLAWQLAQDLVPLSGFSSTMSVCEVAMSRSKKIIVFSRLRDNLGDLRQTKLIHPPKIEGLIK